ncbi:c-type cytochrome [Halomonas sp. WWR20]
MRKARALALMAGLLSGMTALGTAAQPSADDRESLTQGEYLARAADCIACHVTEGGEPFAGGLAFELPFGTLYSPNITPDKETGIGDWSDDDFINAMQKGVGKDGRHYYPAFPYTSYTLMSRDEILAIKAYLFSLAPVHQPNRKNDIGFPFNQRWGMALWNWLFLDDERFQPDPARSDTWNRGAYLVQGPGHCGECHTPRNLFQARDESQHLAGAIVDGWHAWNITSDPEGGIGAWPDEQLVSYLAIGRAWRYGVAAGPMAEVVSHSLNHLSEADIQAIVTYLKSVPAQPAEVTRPPEKTLSNHMPADSEHPLGVQVFAKACANCHTWDGRGTRSAYAALIGLRTVHDPDAVNLVQVLLEGADLHTRQGAAYMPGFDTGYSDEELAAVSRFVLSHFGSVESPLDAATIANRREP